MKRILTFVFLSLSFTAWSQKITLGLSGGTLFNSAPFEPTKKPHNVERYYTNVNSKENLALGVTGAINVRKIQLGLGCQVSTLEYSYEAYYGKTAEGLVTSTYKGSYVNPYIFANFKKNLLRSCIYAGLNIGVAIHGNGETNTKYLTRPLPRQMATSPLAITGGVQVGYHVHLYKGLGIFVETGARYVSSGPSFYAYDEMINVFDFTNEGFLSFPVMGGLSYTL